MSSPLLNVRHQLTFYGAYHDNPVNVAIHMIFVPILLWTGLVMGSVAPVPSFFPNLHFVINDYLAFDFNWAAVWAIACLTYYTVLEPAAGLLYLPQMVLMTLTSASYAHKAGGIKVATITHIVSWLAQFAGHFIAEGRSPALLDNLLGAVVLAPFFVHLEILFRIGAFPGLQKDVHASITEEIQRIKATKGKKAP